VKRHSLETIIGAIVISVTLAFLFFAYSVYNLNIDTSYIVKANFLKVGGLQPGSPIRISGVQVGTVQALSLNNKSFEAEVLMEINTDILLPKDTIATIAGDGFLGGKYVDLEPGSSDLFLENNETISKTVDFQALEDLVGDIIFSITN
jgi:phospholipid/cholesterol/gamma-HCH transport system substrate-binding protein